MTEWIISSNRKYFLSDEYFEDNETLYWFQTSSMKRMQPGDIVYLYISLPVSEIHWKLTVLKVQVPFSELPMDTPDMDERYYPTWQSDQQNSFGSPGDYYVLFQREKRFTLSDKLAYSVLKEHGQKSRLMGTERMRPEVSEYVHRVEALEGDAEQQEQDAFQIGDPKKLKQLAIRYSKRTGTKKNTNGTTFSRNGYVSAYAKMRANGICQLCGLKAPFMDNKGRPYLESHHIVWLSVGGADSIDNTTALCPNCHRKMHIVRDPQDVATLQEKVREE